MTDIELIKSKLDIVQIISSYLPELKKAGSNYKANCPFHSEKSPSFMVNPSLQIYKCFGCGKGGDVINFIQEIERVDFTEALKISAEKAHVDLNTYTSATSKKEEMEKKRIIEANTLTAKFYHYILSTHSMGKSGREYAQKRGIDGERIKDFMMGYAPNSKDSLKKYLLQKGFEERDLINWGLLVERNYNSKNITIDKFRHRLMHPILNLKGEVIAFSGRYIGTSKEAPKYLNSPETLVYKKNENLYGLYQAKESMRKENFVIVEEGNVDILSSHRVGIKNIVAPLGTAFTENQAKLLKRFVDEFYFCFDTDNAGISALIKSIGIAENLEIKHRVIDINPYKDPDDLIMKEPSEWKTRVDSSINTYEYLIYLFSKEVDLNNVDGKVKFSSRIIPILRQIKDEISLSHFIKKVSILLEVSEDILKKKIKDGKSINRASFSELEPKDKELANKKVFGSNEVKLESYFISLLISANFIKKSKFPKEAIYNDELRNIYVKLLESKEKDPASIYDELNEIEKHYFEEIMMFDSTSIKNVDDEIKKVDKILKEKYYKKEIMKLRREMKEESNVENLVKLQHFAEELKKLK